MRFKIEKNALSSRCGARVGHTHTYTYIQTTMICVLNEIACIRNKNIVS
jgi:hypothetical protein